MERFWNCWVEGTEGGNHIKHWHYEIAKEEAERLARLPENRGKTVYVMGGVSYCKVPTQPIEWHDI